MPGFPVSGSHGQAPTTVWMSFLADKYTILSPWSSATGFASSSTSLPACKLTNSFITGNSSFGTFATAPDGTTNTAQKIVEDGTTNTHLIQAGCVPINPYYPILRLAGIWKAVERTRIAYQMTAPFAGSGFNTTCGFDLSGGQIAYGATVTGTPVWNVVNQVIYPIGQGFYLCIADFKNIVGSNPAGFNHGFVVQFLIDSGSGTGSPSLTYAGNGTSGLYGWKNSVLPASAWKINQTTFFDDFNDPTLAKFDLNNTKAPGFDWYVQQNWYNKSIAQGWFSSGIVPPPPAAASLSASGSILHVPSQDGSFVDRVPGGISSYSNPDTATFGPYIGGAGVGNGWRPPLVFEASIAYGYPNAWKTGDFSFWSGSCDFADNIANNRVNTTGSINGVELDFYETQGFLITSPIINSFVYNPGIGVLGVNLGLNTGEFSSVIGYPPFESAFQTPNSITYAQGQGVASGGNFYFGNNSGAANPPGPPSANWTQCVYPSVMPPGAFDPLFLTDPAQQHIVTAMILPYDRITKDPGCALYFFDGVFRTGRTWNPNVTSNDNASPYPHTTDGQRLFVMFNQNAPGSTVGSGYDMFVDYFKVMQ